MYKQLLCLLMALLMTASLAACASGGEQDTTATQQTQATAPAQTALPTEETTLAAEETTAPAAFEEIVITDNEHSTFRITAIESDDLFGYTLKVFLENKTDNDLMFTWNDVSVNGFMCDPFWATTVSAGMKANEEIRFHSSDFDVNGIEEVTDITFTLRIYDSNDWSASDLVNDVFTVYPLGEDAVQAYVRPSQEGQIVLFDNEQCAMIVTGFEPDSLYGYAMNVYLENKTDKTLMFSAGDTAVNGFMCDPLWAETVAPGKRSNTQITWMSSDFERNGITDVESISLPVRVYDSNDWTADDLVNETFSVTP